MSLQFGLTPNQPCGYLAEQQERLAVLVLEDAQRPTIAHYQVLLEQGFRRSHNELYRPWCDACQSCQSLRIDTHRFVPSRSQKRILKRNNDLILRIRTHDEPALSEQQSQLFCEFIEQRHRDGSMYPPKPLEFAKWVHCDWLQPLWFEWYLDQRLIAVAAVDRLPRGLSAVYTFFAPDLEDRSLGTFAILEQLRIAREWQLPWLYLGYQIDDCKKMNYKTKFKPNERYIGNRWEKELKS